jgi:hypothetical protein
VAPNGVTREERQRGQGSRLAIPAPTLPSRRLLCITSLGQAQMAPARHLPGHPPLVPATVPLVRRVRIPRRLVATSRVVRPRATPSPRYFCTALTAHEKRTCKRLFTRNQAFSSSPSVASEVWWRSRISSPQSSRWPRRASLAARRFLAWPSGQFWKPTSPGIP